MQKKLTLDFLYLDLCTCERCMATDDTLNEAVAEISGVLSTLGYELAVNKVNVKTRALAEQYRFLSSPTIRVNGADICGSVEENDCRDCGNLCGDSVDCRVFLYDGKQYNQPPKAMIMDGILRAIYQPTLPVPTEYILPDNLEHFFSGIEQTNFMKEGTRMKTMQIFEPAMCCDTGLCGVGVDPELLRISTVLNTLKQNGIIVKRFNLNNAPMEFVNNNVVNGYINEKGAEGLPVVLLDGKIIITGRYPTNEEFTNLLSLPAGLLGNQSAKVTPEKTGGCNCNGGCC